MVKLRLASRADFETLVKRPPPARWVGLVAESDGQLLGIGGVLHAEDGRWWVSLERRPGVRLTKTLWRAAWQLLAALADARIAALWSCAIVERMLFAVETSPCSSAMSSRFSSSACFDCRVVSLWISARCRPPAWVVCVPRSWRSWPRSCAEI